MMRYRCDRYGDLLQRRSARVAMPTGGASPPARLRTAPRVNIAVTAESKSIFAFKTEKETCSLSDQERTFILLTLFSQCMGDVEIPMLAWRPRAGVTVVWFPLFKLFPVLLTIMLMWAVCLTLTMTGQLPAGHPARTDVKLKIIEDAPWFRIPYPGQWGLPTVSVAGVLGMLAGVLACTVESISYYPTTARMCAAPPPPLHAINRGLGTEGLGTVLAGLWGSGNGTNTFGENVGAIGVTKVGSRRVVQWAAGLMLLQGVIGKFGAVFIIIPQPIIGGLFCVMFGMISAFGKFPPSVAMPVQTIAANTISAVQVERVLNSDLHSLRLVLREVTLFAGLSALQHVSLRSCRNLYIVGFSLFFPLVLTRWVAQHGDVINTGVEALDAVLQSVDQVAPPSVSAAWCVQRALLRGIVFAQVLLSTSILVGGLVGCLLDNLIPGSAEERGLAAWAREMALHADGARAAGDTYDFPVGMHFIRKWKWTSYLPFMPTYQAGKFFDLFRKKKDT
ncbi:hypothetical protein EVAR_99372_1 [Eumeta japonica]|uniref:Solute carrier family 23 member 2 n=1 Tax=Eumeta variegata TaxID=151549 RepID=A0A4C1YRS9_EUMVA|nr:hypothetical protein EVAR_99372_1 [Eumeta japonica]